MQLGLRKVGQNRCLKVLVKNEWPERSFIFRSSIIQQHFENFLTNIPSSDLHAFFASYLLIVFYD